MDVWAMRRDTAWHLGGHIPKETKLVDVVEWARRRGQPFTLSMAVAELPWPRHKINISLGRLVSKGFLKTKKMPMQRRCGKGIGTVSMSVYFPTKMLMDEPL
jgi:hypothetical protein